MNIKYNREDILDKGGKLIRLHGYHYTAINDITKAAQISKGSFYSHFESKEDFLMQLIKRYGENQLKIIHYFLQNKKLTPINRLSQFYQSKIDYHISQNFKDGCLLNNLSIELGGSSDSIRELLNTQMSQWEQTLGICIQEGQEIEEIKSEQPALELAEILQMSFCGAISRMKAEASASPLELWRKHMFLYLEVAGGW